MCLLFRGVMYVRVLIHMPVDIPKKCTKCTQRKQSNKKKVKLAIILVILCICSSFCNTIFHHMHCRLASCLHTRILDDHSMQAKKRTHEKAQYGNSNYTKEDGKLKWPLQKVAWRWLTIGQM